MSEYSGFANLAWPRKISSQNLIGFRDLAFFMIFSFFFQIFENSDRKNRIKFEFLNPKVESYQGTPKNCKCDLQILLLKFM